VASASSSFNALFGPAGAINGDRRGTNWANGGGWNDITGSIYPDWLQVDFPSPQTISEVDVFTVQDAFTSPVEPFPGQTFSVYGLTSFQVQYWTGAAWAVVPGGDILSNNQVWRQITFSPITTARIRVFITGSLGSYSRITEVEAYADAVPSAGPNVAAAANGATVSASSIFNESFGAAGVIDGDRKGSNWSNGGGWNDGTPNIYPDSIQIGFAGWKTISEIDVFTLQDNFLNPLDPTPGMTFSLYGITDFQVQFWDGSTWVNLPNGTVTGNNLVWRKITFPPIATPNIRIVVNGALKDSSRIVEIEAR
jgi:hypothetical protein